jgi:hypothetical protein
MKSIDAIIAFYNEGGLTNSDLNGRLIQYLSSAPEQLDEAFEVVASIDYRLSIGLQLDLQRVLHGERFFTSAGYEDPPSEALLQAIEKSFGISRDD